MSDKTTYRFIGDAALIHLAGRDIELTELGQKVDLTEDEAKTAARIPLLSDTDFESIGFTADEIKAYRNAALKHQAPADFQKKMQAAVDLFVAKSQESH